MLFHARRPSMNDCSWSRWLGICVALAVLPGCGTFQAATLGPTPDPSIAQDTGVPHATIQVELRQGESKRRVATVPFEEGWVLSDVVRRSGATRKFSGMDVHIERMGMRGEMIKLDARYDRGTKRISNKFDYAIHPNDRIVIIEDNSTMLERMFDSVLEPLGPALN